MIIDAPALIAILLNEPKAWGCARAIASTNIHRVSTVTFKTSNGRGGQVHITQKN
jgi:uncharacterized protein with PIN domain